MLQRMTAIHLGYCSIQMSGHQVLSGLHTIINTLLVKETTKRSR